MVGGASNWSVSTAEGASLDADELVAVLAVHHQRLIDTWHGFVPAQWEHESRNTRWTVHETVRHLADAMQRGAGAVSGEPALGENPFDPRSTPDAWLIDSERESPTATIERYAAASTSLRSGVRSRLASGDSSRDRTVFGTAHWTANVAHLLWDSWLHERDVLLPLGLPAPSSEGEERLVGMYGLLMALVPSMKSGRAMSAVVQLRGSGVRTIEVTCDGESLRSAEVPAGTAMIAGALPAVVDALAGRGDPVADALPGAPAELGFLAAFFNS